MAVWNHRGPVFLTDAIHSLQRRTFRVQLRTTFSTVRSREWSPSGFSPVHCNNEVNGPLSISYSLYVGDVQASSSSASLTACEKQLQLAINKLAKWADRNSFRLFPGLKKKNCVLFTRKRGLFPSPALLIGGQETAVRERSFLGMISDKKHIKELKKKYMK